MAAGRETKLSVVDAMYEYGNFYKSRVLKSFPKNPELAVAWYQHAAEAGHTGAMTKLAEMLFTGEGVAKPDVQSALCWLRLAGNKGYVPAMCLLADMLRTREGSNDFDLYEAECWYEYACELE